MIGIVSGYRHALICTVAVAALAPATASAQAQTYQFNIQSQALDSALRTFAKATRQQILFDAAVVREKRSKPLIGYHRVEDGITMLLASSGLEATKGSGGAYVIQLREPAVIGAATANATRPVPGPAGLRVRDTEPDPAPAIEGNEIIVTAQKREERLKDVPVPVTAVTANDLLALNQTKAQEFFASVPGLNLQFYNNRAQLAIRGITTGPVTGNPVVGFTIDDVPYGASTGQGGLFGSAPDLDPSELARIEVLRGPQGTLYGASSMGGLVKYVTADPDLSRLKGTIGGGVNMIRYGGGTLGYNLRGAVNIPVSETVAVRASGFVRKDPGYIDNVRTGEKDVNSSRVIGGRLSALWKPSDSFSLKLSALHQVRDIFGSPNVDTLAASPYQQTDQIGAGRSRSKNQLYTATVKADLGGIDLTSITAYSRSTNYDYADFTASLQTSLYPDIYPSVSDFGNILYIGYDVDKFSHETRLAGSVGSSLDWIVGGFYTHEKAKYAVETAAINPTDGSAYGFPLIFRDNAKFQEYAAFANLTLNLSDQFDVQMGGRASKNKQSLTHREWVRVSPEPDLPLSRVTTPRAKGDSVTFQFSPRFKPSPDHMFYGRIATGYRPGGPNMGCNDDPIEPVSCQFKPDKTVNYEIGAKGDLFHRALSYDVSLFKIDWRGIQITQVSSLGTSTYNINAGKARSRGVEVALEARPTDRFTMSFWWAYVDATLSESFASTAIFAAEGDRLPYSSNHSGRFSLDYEARVAADVNARLGASATYVGERKGEFVQTVADAPLRQSYPGYVQFDLNTGIEFSDWSLRAFVQNVTDKHGVIGGGYFNQTTFNRNWFNYVQPRTVGLNLEYNF